jgi:hypothetical protein
VVLRLDSHEKTKKTSPGLLLAALQDAFQDNRLLGAGLY